MIRSVILKFVSFLMAACFLFLAAGSMLGVGFLGIAGLYDRSPQEIYAETIERQGQFIADYAVRCYASAALGGCTEAVLEQAVGNFQDSAEGQWNAVIKHDNELVWAVNGMPKDAQRMEYNISTNYYSMSPEQNGSDEPTTCVTVMEDDQWVDYALYEVTSPVYTVIVQLSPSYALGSEWAILDALYAVRFWLIALACVSLLLFAASLICLCCAAGRTYGSKEVHAGGINRLPLDLYTGILGGLGVFTLWIGIELLDEATRNGIGPTALILGAMIGIVLSLLVIAFLFALAAQLKTKDGYWWRNSIIGRVLIVIWKAVRWIFRSLFRLFGMLALIWQFLLVGGFLGLLMIVWPLVMQTNDFIWEVAFFLVPMLYLVFLGYTGYALGTVYRGVKKMRQGELSHKVNTRYLFGSLRQIGEGLNAVSEAAAIAAEKQLRSERMKTELITNVSHDIKTPLTSIINYVDLLQKPHTQQQQDQYLDVLSRQSLRLKKLIDDLMEMSKASTGNMTAHIEPLDAVEAVQQALGEFSDKLASVNLTPVLDAPEEPVMILGDSRLLWRVLSNLLSNAVKYAMPGTRVYVGIRQHQRSVLLVIKNISAQQLGISADELMERFVRGDASRNTEGSGLGLNIAKSLMELQKGQLKLTVDGDLFKVTLVFPRGDRF